MQVVRRSHIVQTEDWAKQVKHTLNQFRHGRTPSSIWRNTYLLSGFNISSKLDDELQHIMKAIIVKNLRSARDVIGIRQHDAFVTENQYHFKDVYRHDSDLDEQLQLDMGDNSPAALKHWSMLYHFYFVAPLRDVAYIAQHAFRVDRQVRNYRTDGIKRLLRELIREEKSRITALQTESTFHARTFIERRAENMIDEARVARGLDNEQEAIRLSEKAVDFALRNELPRYYVKAAAIKIFIMLQGDANAVTAAAEFLHHVENSHLITSVDPSPDQWWILTKIHSMWAHLWRRNGDLKEARLSAEKAVTYLHQLAFADKKLVKDTYLISGLMYWASGLYVQAQSAFESALQSGVENNYDVYEMLGLTYWVTGQYKLAESHFEQAIAQASAQLDNWNLANQKGNLALVYLFRGQLTQSQKYIEDHRETTKKLKSWKEYKRASANLGLVLMHRGELDKARPLLEEAHKRYQTVSAPMSLMLITLTLSQLNTLEGNHEIARGLATSVLACAEQRDDEYLPKMLVYRCLGGCELLDNAERVWYLEKAIDLARGHRPFDVAASELGLSVLHPSANKRFQYWHSGSTTLQKIGAGRWLRRFQDTYPHLPILS